jgi:hypothetical protein
MLLLAVLGLIPKNRGGYERGRRPLALTLGVTLALVFGPILTVQLDYRYAMPALAFAPLGAVLGGARLWRAFRLRQQTGQLPTAEAEAVQLPA